MAVRLKQNKKIFIETEYNNIVVVNPNEVFNSEGKNEERLVDHEDLVYYANLETFIIPRTKLAIGESFDSPVVNTTVAATMFGGDDALKINFLKPKGKTQFDTSWSNQLTGEGSVNKKGINQTVERAVSFGGRQSFKKSVGQYEDTQLLGIKSIKVNIKGTGVPEVNIELVDIQGRSLFEQGENSLYSAFFNYPYPLFYLTLKGYYGKAVRYRLSLLSFNANFDADTGNYNISLKLIGKFTALLFDTPLSYAVTAPKMFNTKITETDPITKKSRQFNTYKGRQKLDEVYKIYKRKGLIPETFPHYSLEQFVYAASEFKTNIEKDLEKQEDFTKLNDLEDYSQVLTKLEKEVYDYAISTFLDRDSFYVSNGEVYYPFKISIDFQSREDVKTLIKKRITEYVQKLKDNATFGEIPTAKNQIKITIKDEKQVIKKLDFNQWLNNPTDVKDTYFQRTGRQLESINSSEYVKFIQTESTNALLENKVLDQNNEWVEDTPDYFVFGDKIVDDGSYTPNSYLDNLSGMRKNLEAAQKVIEDNLTKFYAERQLKQPSSGGQGGLGFNPTIRNVFAIIFAGADAFYRLMEDNHTDAWNVRTEKKRLDSVIGNRNDSVDALNSISKSSTELNDDNVVYPWPLYYTLEKQKEGPDLYTIQYPGDAKYIKQTNAYDYRIWPEVAFVESFIKASVEKELKEEKYNYDNPTEVTEYVACNAIEFPFKTAPYQDLNAIKIFYELFERTYINSFYGNLPLNVSQKNQIDDFYAQIETQNLKLVAPEDITINQTLKNFKLNSQTLLDYMKNISNQGKGESWQKYIRAIYNTDYLSNLLKDTNEIYSIDTLLPNSLKVSADLQLSENMDSFLNDTDTSKKGILDTYPFTNIEWLKENMANGNSIESYEDFNNTTKSYVLLEDKKTIARVNQKGSSENIKLFTTNSVFQNNNQPYLTNLRTNTKIDNALSMKNFYTERESKDLYLTESYINYGNSYSGNLGTFIQTTSLLNTPYFINSLITGVTKHKNKFSNPFVSLGYLFLNSLPLITTKEKLKNFSENTYTDLDYLASTFNKFSSIHQVPYAWVLKYGSIWHRYKRYVENNVDILDDVWKDFDYTDAYDPTSGNTYTDYTVLDYNGNPFTISLQKTIPYLAYPSSNLPVIQKYKDVFNTGFYPKVINAVEYYLNGEDLITGYSPADFADLYNKGLKIGLNGDASYSFNEGFDKQYPIRSLLKNNIYTYRKYQDDLTGANKVILYPSTGGIPFDQSIFECFNNQNVITKDILNNPAMYNGTVRTVWGMSNFGYFDNKLIKKPSVTEYLKVIKTNNSVQDDFTITNTESTYSNIEEIFNVFDVELLNKMEEKFLTFCQLKPFASKLKLNEENIKSTYTSPNGLTNADLKLLKTQIQSILSLDGSLFEEENENSDGETLGNKQITSMYGSLTDFLNFDCVLKIGNPTKFDRKLFYSFSDLTNVQITDKYNFNPYKTGTLPGDGTSVTLLDSLTNNKDAWNALRKYIGFSTISGIDYPNQVQSVFPSTTPITNTQTNPIQLEFKGDYASVYPTLPGPTQYINLKKTDGSYQVYKIIGEPNVQDIVNKIGLISFYQPYSNIDDPSNLVQSTYINNLSTNNSYVATILDVAPGNYQMVVTYYENLVSTQVTKLVASVSTFPNNQTTGPQLLTAAPLPQPLPTTQLSYVSDFFIDNNIEFTKNNVELLHPLIRVYIDKKLDDSNYNKNKLTTFVNEFIFDKVSLQNSILNKTFDKLNKELKNIEIDNGLPKTAVNGDVTKLSLYNTLKTFNDKWIAGSDLTNTTLFEDFLFMDRANSDVGDSFTVDINQVIKRIDLENNQKQSIMSLVSSILEDNFFIFMAMPSYVNFYGIQEVSKNPKALQDSEIGNSLFGTYLEVDYTKSSPKFLCLYIGNPSEYPKPKENTFNRFGDDSFDLRVPNNPVNRENNKNINLSLSNRVVGFAVDFGIRNQNIFKGLSLDMSEKKNTSESFQVYADMGNSVAGDKVAQQSTSLYSVYKSRSYACGVQSMGNAMIQPTMYFILRHVPMFYGPYWITEVNHNISERGFDTEFKGTRIPKYALPKVDNLLSSVNKVVISKIKELAKTKKTPPTTTTIEEDKLRSKNATITTLESSESNCQPKVKSMYSAVPFVELNQTVFTRDEIAPIIKSLTTDTSMRAMLLGIAESFMEGTTNNNGVYNCINNNPYEISTENIFGGNLIQFITSQSCTSINGKPKPLVKFDTLNRSTEFMVSYMTSVIPLLPSFLSINSDTDINKKYGKSLLQLSISAWETRAAFGDPDAIPPVPAQTPSQIKTTVTNNLNAATYNLLVNKFADCYKYFVLNP
jgi:hypothetical protein